MKRLLSLFLILALLFCFSACGIEGTGLPDTPPQTTVQTQPSETDTALDEEGTYDSKEDVALYIHQYGKLPQNFMTKSEAKAQGWRGGALSNTLPGKCIGGDIFQNREGLLPKKEGRQYYECDIGTLSTTSRGALRIVFSNDGLVYYTSNHYESFELLYGEP